MITNPEIALVEDNRINQGIMSRQLKKLYPRSNVTILSSGEKAIKSIVTDSYPYDLIILDGNLGDQPRNEKPPATTYSPSLTCVTPNSPALARFATANNNDEGSPVKQSRIEQIKTNFSTLKRILSPEKDQTEKGSFLTKFIKAISPSKETEEKPGELKIVDKFSLLRILSPKSDEKKVILHGPDVAREMVKNNIKTSVILWTDDNDRLKQFDDIFGFAQPRMEKSPCNSQNIAKVTNQALSTDLSLTLRKKGNESPHERVGSGPLDPLKIDTDEQPFAEEAVGQFHL